MVIIVQSGHTELCKKSLWRILKLSINLSCYFLPRKLQPEFNIAGVNIEKLLLILTFENDGNKSIVAGICPYFKQTSRPGQQSV